MEDAVSSSMGAMGPVHRKLDLLLAPESRLRKRVKDGIGLLKQDLEEVSSVLLDLSMLETPSARAKCWMEEARELSYHIEDFVDELILMRTDASSKIRTASRHRVGRAKIAQLPPPPRRGTRIAKIAQLRALLLQATERFQRYQLEACCSSPNHMNMITQHRPAPALYGDAANLVGIEVYRTKLIETLTWEAEQQLKVVSIVGPAGVGKTTLAKEIFRELRGEFDSRALVHASRKIDMRRLLGSILSQVQPQLRDKRYFCLIDSIQEQLRDKRYLIVIDDLWEETAWDIVRGAFPEDNNCSRIVATTENMNVGLNCCSYMADNILGMKPLGLQDSEYLFFNRVFGSEQQCPDELKEVSCGIIRKCCGLPLSLVHVAGLLASTDYLELWYHVHDCLCSILNRSHTVEEIQKKILNFSYNSLPPSLKTCLLYFNMYPEGYIMWKVHLVKRWIAEGFINAAEGKDREEIAEGYFEELVNRGMVQPMKVDYNDEVLSCTVHHIIFDIINDHSKEVEFIAAVDYSQPITGLSTKAHRLSFRFSSAKYAKQPARITMSHLRSFGFFGFLKCMPPIVEFKHLRVLVLDFWGNHDGHRSLDLSRISILFQLRHLTVSGDIMVKLPAKMQGLHYLETIDIDARLAAVPLDIVHLPSLLHLCLRAATKLPNGIGHIKSLSTLLYFDLSCNSEDNIWSLSKLTNLQHLHLTCSASLSNDHLKRKLIPLVFSLGKFCNLKSLTLTPDGLRTSIFFDVWSGISSPPMFLQKLELLPPICFFYRLPTWIGELHKLCILKIVVKELHGNDISNISGLPSLSVFSLYVRTALTGTVVFSTMAFPALKYFKFTCGVMCLAFQEGAMPNLQRVKLCFNAHRGNNHNRVLDGIEHLLNLHEVVGRIGVLPGADESDWRVAELSFEDIIRKHPRCPRFNSQLVGFIQEEYSPFLMKQEYPPLDKFPLMLHGGSSSEHEIVEKACAEDMDKHIDSRLSREVDLPPASGTSYHHKSDEYSRHHMLVSILRDESAEPTTLDLSLLEDITNNFSTEQEIDQGGFGMVYKGILGDGLIVAVKRLCGPCGTVDGQLARVVDCLMTVKHSNIVRFLGYWAHTQLNVTKQGWENLHIDQQDILLCFEYLYNGSLSRHITEESCGFEWHTRYQIMKGICQGLDYLHQNHIVHLHLKPENILLDANMVPKITDYAYSRLLGEDRRTATKEIVTLLDYMAPEYHEDGAINLKCDIYSLGVIIMQMVTGHKDHPNIESVLGGWRSRLESDTSWRHTALETAYRQVILCIEMGKSCMHRDPSKRPCIRNIIDTLAGMETSDRSSTTSGTSSIPKVNDFSMPFSPEELFGQSDEESEALLMTSSPTSGKDSLSHYQQIKKSAEIEHLFHKVVTPSDVGKLNRLVLPKQHAEKYFPLCVDSDEKGLILSFEDEAGKPWRFRYSYWNSSQSYVLTKGWSKYVKEKGLHAGDEVHFQRMRGLGTGDRLFISYRRRVEQLAESVLAPAQSAGGEPQQQPCPMLHGTSDPYQTSLSNTHAYNRDSVDHAHSNIQQAGESQSDKASQRLQLIDNGGSGRVHGRISLQEALLRINGEHGSNDGGDRSMMGSSGSSSDPVLASGFRFFPTEEELLTFYLRHWLAGTRPDVEHLIPVVDIYGYHPSELQAMAGVANVNDTEQWFFFCPRAERELHGGRPARTTPSGYWKAMGLPSYIYSLSPATSNRVIGEKRTMVFYQGRSPTGNKTRWKMNEYKAIAADDADDIAPPPAPGAPIMLRNEFSVCRVYIRTGTLRSFDRRPLNPPGGGLAVVGAQQAVHRGYQQPLLPPAAVVAATTTRHHHDHQQMIAAAVAVNDAAMPDNNGRHAAAEKSHESSSSGSQGGGVDDGAGDAAAAIDWDALIPPLDDLAFSGVD